MKIIPNMEKRSSIVFSPCRDVLVPETGRVDFFGSYAADHVDGGLIARELQTIMQVSTVQCSAVQYITVQYKTGG